MGILSTVYNIPEVTNQAASALVAYGFSSPVKQEYGITLTNISEKVFNLNMLSLWNFGDPFAEEIDDNSNEYRSTNLLEIVGHKYKYAGVYTVNGLLYIDKYFLQLTKKVEINNGEFPALEIQPPSGTYRTTQLVTFKSYDSAIRVYYTDDGSDPFTSPTVKLYSGPIELLADESRVVDFRYFGILSTGRITAEYTAAYNIIALSPVVTIAPSGLLYGEPIDVTLTYEQDFFRAEYSLNGGEWIEYAGSFPVSANTTVRYRTFELATGDGPYPADPGFEIKYYIFDFVLPELTITPSGGEFTNFLDITATPNKSGCTITYELSGGPTTVYTTMFDLVVAMNLDMNGEAIYTVPVHFRITDTLQRFTDYDLTYTVNILPGLGFNRIGFSLIE